MEPFDNYRPSVVPKRLKNRDFLSGDTRSSPFQFKYVINEEEFDIFESDGHITFENDGHVPFEKNTSTKIDTYSLKLIYCKA